MQCSMICLYGSFLNLLNAKLPLLCSIYFTVSYRFSCKGGLPNIRVYILYVKKGHLWWFKYALVWTQFPTQLIRLCCLAHLHTNCSTSSRVLDYPCMEIISGALGPMGCLVHFSTLCLSALTSTTTTTRYQVLGSTPATTSASATPVCDRSKSIY